MRQSQSTQQQWQIDCISDNLINTYNIIKSINKTNNNNDRNNNNNNNNNNNYRLDIYNHLRAMIKQQTHPNTTKTINNSNKQILRFNYFLIFNNLQQISFQQLHKTQQYLNQHIMQYQQICQINNKIVVTIVPFIDIKSVYEHIGMIRKISSQQFQGNYIKLIDQIQKNTEERVFRHFCREQLGWSQTQTNKFRTSQNITTIDSLLTYKYYKPYQQIKINKAKMLVDRIINKNGINQSR